MQINLMPDLSLLAIMGIFILNYLVVRTFFLKPVNEILEARETETRTADEAYENALARFNEAAARMETQLHTAKREAAQLRDKARGEAAAYRQQLVERTQAVGKTIVSEADEQLSRDVAEARSRIATEADELARLAVQRILGRAV
jgi:F-type H+-transporting ATPase subunit b